MGVPTIDLEDLAKACSAGDLSPFAAERNLGFTLDDDTRRALLHSVANTNYHRTYNYGRSRFTLAHALGTIAEAANNESGIAITEQVGGLGLGKEIAIAFRQSDAIYFSVRYASNTPMTPGNLWPELKPWYKVLERNRKQLEAWVTATEGIVRIPRTGDSHAGAPSEQRGLDGLLTAIIENPHDSSLRLVYADALLAKGDVQGELIQLCEQHQATPDAGIEKRINALETNFRERIAGEVAQLTSSFVLRQGFVSQIEMAAPTFAKHGERILANHPIERLDLKPVNDKALAQLARAKPLAKLRGLYLSQIIGHTRPMSLDEICRSTLFDKLESLEIWTWVTSGSPMESFARFRAPKLERLRLYEVDSAPEILSGLARNDQIRLRQLQVDRRASAKWPSVFSSPAFSDLTHLDLSIHSKASLLEGVSLPKLVSLSVPEFPAPSSLELPALERLTIDECRFDEKGFEQLLRALPNLKALSLWEMPNLSRDQAKDIALALPQEHPLVALRLPGVSQEYPREQEFKDRFSQDFYKSG